MILGADGQPLAERQAQAQCPECGSEKREQVNGFGGYSKVLCSNCGFDFGDSSSGGDE